MAEPTRSAIHWTAAASVQVARQGIAAPAICPGCTLLSAPILRDAPMSFGPPDTVPVADVHDLVDALAGCTDAGASLINPSLSVLPAVPTEHEARDYCAARGVLVVAATGNAGIVGPEGPATPPWTIPVVPCTASGGRPLDRASLSASAGRRGPHGLRRRNPHRGTTRHGDRTSWRRRCLCTCLGSNCLAAVGCTARKHTRSQGCHCQHSPGETTPARCSLSHSSPCLREVDVTNQQPVDKVNPESESEPEVRPRQVRVPRFVTY
jgi:hypothetical protein